MKCIDLHTHSTESDGSFTPEEIIDLAIKNALSVVALTDHDTVAGIANFIKYTENKNIIPISGVEISSTLKNKEIHIVGLFVDYKNLALNDFLLEIRKERDLRNMRIIENLNKLGYEITIDEVLTVASGDSVGRPHFAKILIKKGYFKENQSVFDTVLKRGRPGYSHRVLPTPEETITKIHNAGGIAIWAHPVWRKKNASSFVRNIVKKLMIFGLDGVETYYSSFSNAQHKMMKKIALEYDLLQSGGSDFHGANQPTIKLASCAGNFKVPFELYENLIKDIKNEE